MPRKKKPREMRLVAGNSGHRPLPGHSPTVEGRLVRPGFLSVRSAELFDEHAALAHWLTPADASLLALWATLMSEFEADPGGMSAARIGNMRSAGAALGLDPSTRANFAGPPEETLTEEEKRIEALYFATRGRPR